METYNQGETIQFESEQIPIKKMSVKLSELFSVPVVSINIGRNFTEDELQVLSDVSIEKNKEKEQKNHQSLEHYLFDKHKELESIENFCKDQLERYLQKIEGVDTDIASLRITQSWLNNTKPQEFHHAHCHPNSYLSGVLYINCLPKNDMIVFENRLHGIFNTFSFPTKGLTKWTAKDIPVEVKEGDLIIFPSWLVHHVNINETTDTERISISFNTFPIGDMGDISSATHLKL